MISPQPWLGIDVSKATFDVALPVLKGFAQSKFPRDRAGAVCCLKWARQQLPGVSFACVMEATGGYSKQLACWLLNAQADLHVAIAQPFQVRHFTQALGQRNKTDALDAVVLARFGTVFLPRAFHPMPTAYERLRALERERDASCETPPPWRTVERSPVKLRLRSGSASACFATPARPLKNWIRRFSMRFARKKPWPRMLNGFKPFQASDLSWPPHSWVNWATFAPLNIRNSYRILSGSPPSSAPVEHPWRPVPT